MEKKFNHTLTSPAHRQTSVNDFTTKYNSDTSSSAPKTKNRKVSILDEVSEANDNLRCYPRNLELCTIIENKNSDAERSGDTFYDEDSTNSVKKLTVDESSKLLSEHSPILTIVDSERTIFSKRRSEVDDILKNIYGNEAFEEHTTDKTNLATDEREKLKHSCSLDLIGTANETKRRKLSESKLDPNIFKDTVVTKFFEQNSRQSYDNFKSYLCSLENAEGGEKL